jgi:hypothetical protein
MQKLTYPLLIESTLGIQESKSGKTSTIESTWYNIER